MKPRHAPRVGRAPLLIITSAFAWASPVFSQDEVAVLDRIQLGTLGGSWSYAVGINDAGQVCGSSGAPDGFGHAFVWTPDPEDGPGRTGTMVHRRPDLRGLVL